MMKLIGCNTVDLLGSEPTQGLCACGAQPDEPIHVRVRVRQYPDALPEVRQPGRGNLDFGRMPVGVILDCYV